MGVIGGGVAGLTLAALLAWRGLDVTVYERAQPGGKLQIQAPIEAAELVRLIARRAWEVGAVDVNVRYGDPQLARLLFDHAPDAALDYAPAWAAQEAMHRIDDGYAFLNISGSDPDLLAGADQARIARRSKADAQLGRAAGERMMAFEVNWSVGAMPVASCNHSPGLPSRMPAASCSTTPAACRT